MPRTLMPSVPPKSCSVVQMKGAPKKDALFHFCHSPLPSVDMSTTTNLSCGTAFTKPLKLDACAGESQLMIAHLTS